LPVDTVAASEILTYIHKLRISSLLQHQLTWSRAVTATTINLRVTILKVHLTLHLKVNFQNHIIKNNTIWIN